VSVVSDASPLVSLARLGHLELLHALYGVLVRRLCGEQSAAGT